MMMNLHPTHPRVNNRQLELELSMQELFSKMRFASRRNLADTKLNCAKLELAISVMYSFNTFHEQNTLQLINKPIVLKVPTSDNASDQTIFDWAKLHAPNNSAAEEAQVISEVTRMLAAEVKIGSKKDREEMMEGVYEKMLGEVRNKDKWDVEIASKARAQAELEISEDSPKYDKTPEIEKEDEFFKNMLNNDTYARPNEYEHQFSGGEFTFNTQFGGSNNHNTGYEAGGFEREERFFEKNDGNNGFEMEFRPPVVEETGLNDAFNSFSQWNQVSTDKPPNIRPDQMPGFSSDDNFFGGPTQITGYSQGYETQQGYQNRRDQEERNSAENSFDQSMDSSFFNTPGPYDSPEEHSRQQSYNISPESQPNFKKRMPIFDEPEHTLAREEDFFGTAPSEELPKPQEVEPVDDGFSKFNKQSTQFQYHPKTEPHNPHRITSEAAHDNSQHMGLPDISMHKPKMYREDEFFTAPVDLPDADDFFNKPIDHHRSTSQPQLTSSKFNPKTTEEIDLLGLDIGEPATPVQPESKGFNPFEEEPDVQKVEVIETEMKREFLPVKQSHVEPEPEVIPSLQNFYVLQEETIEYKEENNSDNLTVTGTLSLTAIGKPACHSRVKIALKGDLWSNEKAIFKQTPSISGSSCWNTGPNNLEVQLNGINKVPFQHYSLKGVLLKKDKLPVLIKTHLVGKKLKAKLFTNRLYNSTSIAGLHLSVKMSRKLNKFQFDCTPDHSLIQDDRVVWQLDHLKIGDVFELELQVNEFSVKIEELKSCMSLKTSFDDRLAVDLYDANHLNPQDPRQWRSEENLKRNIDFTCLIVFNT